MPDVVVLGCGYTGSAVARLARDRGLSAVGFVRSEERAKRLRDAGFDVRTDRLDASALTIAAGAHVVIAYPPDPETEARVAPLLASARSIAYVSSTAVYGSKKGIVNDDTPLPEPNERARKVLAAESAYRAVGATVFRSPAIYGSDRGLHIRIARGEHRIPGDGTGHISRIHVEDLAQLLLAARDVRGETFVVGDLTPATQNEITSWICEEYAVPMPPRVPLEEVHETLRGDRRVDGKRALAVLGVELRYPDYRMGMARLP